MPGGGAGGGGQLDRKAAVRRLNAAESQFLKSVRFQSYAVCDSSDLPRGKKRAGRPPGRRDTARSLTGIFRAAAAPTRVRQ